MERTAPIKEIISQENEKLLERALPQLTWALADIRM
jgi:hypothetical protein